MTSSFLVSKHFIKELVYEDEFNLTKEQERCVIVMANYFDDWMDPVGAIIASKSTEPDENSYGCRVPVLLLKYRHLWFRLSVVEDAQLTPLLRLGDGACAGIIAMFATYTMDMVRGRLTVQTDKSPYQYSGMFHALSIVLCEEGFRALYKGWLPSVIGVVSSGTIISM
ncbi:unnamed protein product [Fraxinus pennsylvanica]|uniref:Uncharacterized protein n=1 Tax=Fraxinus pennsylvanica TaxID=56036 RepID=A0AAD2E6S4_9LAMI|nr:unnamed protein product [Fraxinus pennsylvanica]